MFDKVSDSYIEIYDSITNEYAGRAVFKITPEAENAILNYVRNERQPRQVVLQDVYFYPASSDVIVPLPFRKHRYKGILNVMLRDKYSRLWNPVKIRTEFNIMERTQPANDQYNFASVEFSDIVIKGITVMTGHTSGMNQ